jgi:pilus assembly protein Flp/PilA
MVASDETPHVGSGSVELAVSQPEAVADAERRTYIWLEEKGQGLAEYALILALIAIVAIVALIFLGGQVSKILSTVGKSV